MFSIEDSGKREGSILFFIHGWPDTGALWNNQVKYFSQRYRCITITLPGYASPGPYIGYEFDELATGIADLIRLIKTEAHNKDLTLIGHDWGAYLTYLIDQRHPDLAARVITMDVGAHFVPWSIGHAIFMVSYQWWLASAFVIGSVLRPIGGIMTKLFSMVARTPRGWRVSCRMNYLYFYLWRAVFVKKYKTRQLQKYLITKPLLYLYGKDKRYHFHSRKWPEIVEKAAGGQVVGIDGGDHWFMLRHPDATNRAIDGWLAKQK